MKFTVFCGPEFVNAPVAQLDISTRAANAFGRSGIRTIGQLIERWDELGNIKNLGDKTVKEIRAALFAANLDRIWDNDELLSRFAETLEV